MDSRPRTCTLCKKDMPPEAVAQRTITGTICQDCLNNVGAQSGMPLRDFLDTLGVPVLMVDSDMVVTTANKPLLALFGKNFSQVRGQRGGDVFECAYAQLPGGCGRTVHCSGCTIRRAVTETFTTGRSLQGVLAYLNRDAVTQFQQLGMLVSTEKMMGMVLLRIDYIGPPQEARPQSLPH